MQMQETPNLSKLISDFKSIEKIIFSLNENNIQDAVSEIIKYSNPNFPLSFNLLISRFLLEYFISNYSNPTNIILDFIEALSCNNDKLSIIDTFAQFLLNIDFNKNEPLTNTSSYLLEQMVERKMIQPDFVKKLFPKRTYFIHYSDIPDILNAKEYHKFEISNDYVKLLSDDFALHKEYVHKGENTSELIDAIRNDNVDKLINVLGNYQPYKRIPKSLYEKCSYLNKNEPTLLECCAYFGSVDCYKYLKSKGGEIYRETGNFAIAGGNQTIFEDCLNSKNYKCHFNNPFTTAIKFHRYDIFVYLFENEKFEIEISTIVRKCARHNNFRILSYLMENEKINKNDQYFLYEAASSGNLDLVRCLIEESPKQFPRLMLYHASKSGNYELVKYILDKDEDFSIDINATNPLSRTALTEAAERGFVEIVKLLLQRKDIKIEGGEYSNTPLMLAASQDHLEIVKLLVENGANINAVDFFKRNSLMEAIRKGYSINVVEYLIDAGIDINHKDTDRRTALMHAALKNNTEVMKILLKRKETVVDRKVIAILKKNNNNEIIQMLEDVKKISTKEKCFIA